MYILGINAYHGDSSTCLIKDGVLLAAAEEERFRRIKHWAGFPSKSIEYCLSSANIALSDVDHIAINQDTKSNLLRKIGYTLIHQPSPRVVIDRILNKQKRSNLAEEFESKLGPGFSGTLHEVDHHLSHIFSSYYVSPFRDSAIVSIDGFGDFASTAWGYGKNGGVEIDRKIFFPHSLGIFYQALTQWLGFPNYGDEYKVMGLAPYGQPTLMDEMRKIVHLKRDGSFKLDLEYFRHHKEKVEYTWSDGEPTVGVLYSKKLLHLLGPARNSSEEITQRHRDLARSIQAMYEEAFFNILNHLYKQRPSENLCLAGGCAMNSVANGKIYGSTPFKNVYIQSAAGDAGGAIGAAYATWHKLGGTRNFVMEHSYWGPSFNNEDLGKLIDTEAANLKKQGCEVFHYKDQTQLFTKTAHAISDGKVIGWFQDRMEWGPRALGNRSILGDPRRADMKDILNIKIKRRESFRPFAPSILRECVSTWFEQDDNVPFMMQVYPIKKEKRKDIPAVTHVDGSGRLQTVSFDTNPRYHQLISAFYEITGVPILLNTSFNENEPVVCTPEEALNCFLRTKMDILVLGNWLIERN